MKSMTYGTSAHKSENFEFRPAFAPVTFSGPSESGATRCLKLLSWNDFRTNGHPFSHFEARTMS